jgi:hypothetical protein
MGNKMGKLSNRSLFRQGILKRDNGGMCREIDSRIEKFNTDSTYILIRNDFDVLDMPRSFKDLPENILRDPRVQSPNIQRTLVRFWRGSADKPTSTSRRHNSATTRHGRGDSCRDRVGVLRNDHGSKRRWRHMRRVALVAIALARCRSIIVAV